MELESAPASRQASMLASIPESPDASWIAESVVASVPASLTEVSEHLQPTAKQAQNKTARNSLMFFSFFLRPIPDGGI